MPKTLPILSLIRNEWLGASDPATASTRRSKASSSTSTRATACLHDLAERAISASTALTCASIAGRAISEVQYEYLNQAAFEARRNLLACLEQKHGIDAAMADKLGAIL